MGTNQLETVMRCDPQTGICEIPAQQRNEAVGQRTEKPLRLLYFTDPICSSCWGIEPQLRRLKLEYGAYFDIEYRMGGLLHSWETYGGKDVSGPASVAQHWDEVSAHYGMPIDGDLWLEDPLPSSDPPSIAFKAAQMQDGEKALAFLRRIREMVFVEKKNITRWEHLGRAALETGLDVNQLEKDTAGQAGKAFEADLALARSLGVRGFPTIFFTDEEDNRLKLYGVKPYAAFEQTLLKLFPQAVKTNINTDPESLFEAYTTLTTKEFSVLSDRPRDEAVRSLNLLLDQGKIARFDSKNGPLWRRLS